MLSKRFMIALMTLCIPCFCYAIEITIKNNTAYPCTVGIEEPGLEARQQQLAIIKGYSETQFNQRTDPTNTVLYWYPNNRALPMDVATQLDQQWEKHPIITNCGGLPCQGRRTRNFPEMETKITILLSYHDCVFTIVDGINFMFTYKENGIQKEIKGIGTIISPY